MRVCGCVGLRACLRIGVRVRVRVMFTLLMLAGMPIRVAVPGPRDGVCGDELNDSSVLERAALSGVRPVGDVIT